jgi:hypothetical protein
MGYFCCSLQALEQPAVRLTRALLGWWKIMTVYPGLVLVHHDRVSVELRVELRVEKTLYQVARPHEMADFRCEFRIV